LRSHVPHVLTGLRGALSPLVFFYAAAGEPLPVLTLLCVAGALDLLDGGAARLLRVASREGALFDAAMDFLVVLGGCAGYAVSGVFDPWVPVFMALMFAQFAASFAGGELVYDPVGKWFGSVSIAALLLPVFLGHAAADLGEWIILGHGSLSLTTRWLMTPLKNR